MKADRPTEEKFVDHENYFRVSIKGVVIDQSGKFLLAKENDGKWSLLGGGLNHGEDPVTALKREIKEETGLTLYKISDTPQYFVTCAKLNRRGYSANVIYEIKLKSLGFVMSDECTELRFFNREEALREDLLPQTKQFVDVFNPAQNPGFRRNKYKASYQPIIYL